MIPTGIISTLPTDNDDNIIPLNAFNDNDCNGGFESTVPRSSSSFMTVAAADEPHPSEPTRHPEKRKFQGGIAGILPDWDKAGVAKSDFHNFDEQQQRPGQLLSRQQDQINNQERFQSLIESTGIAKSSNKGYLRGLEDNYNNYHHQFFPSSKKRAVNGKYKTPTTTATTSTDQPSELQPLSSGYGIDDTVSVASQPQPEPICSSGTNIGLYHNFSLSHNVQSMPAQSSSPLVGTGTGTSAEGFDNNNNNNSGQSWTNIPSTSVFSARGDSEACFPVNGPAHSLSSTSLNIDSPNTVSSFASPSFTPEQRLQQFTQHQQQVQGISHTQSLNKRQRIARACDSCRKKKIKCDGKRPACTNCINSRTVCVFTVTERKRAVPKNAKYVDGLEKRIKKLEGLVSSLQPQLKDSALLEDALNGNLTPSKLSSTDLASSGKVSQSPQSDEDEQGSLDEDSPFSSQTINTDLNDRLGTLILLDSGSGAYFGSCSSLSIVSARGLQWIDERTGNKEFSKRLTDLYKTRPADFFISQNVIVGRSDFTPIPPPGMTLLAASLVFDIVSCNMPLFDIGRMKNLLMRVLKRAERGEEHTNTSEYFITNAILAVGTRMLATVKKLSSKLSNEKQNDDNTNKNSDEKDNNNNNQKGHPLSPDYIPLDLPPELDQYSFEDLEETSWKYFHNAANYFTNLCCIPPSLDSIQGMLIMATYLFGAFIPSIAMSMAFITAAVRMAHSLGLHRNSPSSKISPNEIAERRNTWWHVFIFDSMAALRTGRPPLINLEDVSTSLPDEEPEEKLPANNTEGLGLSNRKCLFRLRVELNMISSKVYSKLYSCKAAKLSNSQLLNVIGELDRELLEWRDRVPVEFRPDCEIQVTERPMLLWVLYLHCGYYETMSLIHRMSVHHCSWNSRPGPGGHNISSVRTSRAGNPRVYASAALCVKAARSTILLSNIVDPRDTVLCWAIMPYPMGAFIILFANCIQNPQQSSAQYDLQLMSDFIKFMEPSLAVPTAQRFLNFLNELKSIAEYVVSKNRQERPIDESKPPLGKRQHSSMMGTSHQSTMLENTDISMPDKSNISTASSNFSDAYLNFGSQDSDYDNNQQQQQQPYMGISMPQVEGSQYVWNQHVSPKSNELGVSYTGQSPAPPPLPIHSYGVGQAKQYDSNNPSPIDQEKSIMEQQMMNFEQPFLPQDMWQLPMMDWSLEEWNEDLTGAAGTTQHY